MKKFTSNRAITLIELIISSLLVGIVILGIYSINSVLTNNNQDFGQKYMVKSQTQTTVDHILANAALATGSATPNDQAIIQGSWGQVGTSTVTDNNTFCIHQPTTNNIIGLTVNNGIWLCYEYVPATFQINWCAEVFNNNNSVARGATSCTTALAANLYINPATGVKAPTFLGSANSIIYLYSNGTVVPGSFNFLGLSAANEATLISNLKTNNYIDASGVIKNNFIQINNIVNFTLNTGVGAIDGQKVKIFAFLQQNEPTQFSLTIQNCLSNNATSCNGNGATPGISSDQADNPEMSISANTIPLETSSINPT